MRRRNIGSDAHALNVRDFGRRAFLNGNALAGRDREIQRGNWRGDIKRHVVLFRQHRNRIGSDFVRCVAVRGDAVRARHHGAHFPGLEKMADHVVGDQGERDAAAVKLPGSQARALQVRPRFGHENVQFLSLLEGDPDHAERRSDAAGGKRAGVALRHDLTFSR